MNIYFALPEVMTSKRKKKKNQIQERNTEYIAQVYFMPSYFIFFLNIYDDVKD